MELGIWERFLQSSEVRILLHLSKQGEVRYSKFNESVSSRATLDWALRELVNRGLIRRRVIDARPIQTVYTLTPKGEEATKHLSELTRIVLESNGTESGGAPA